MSTEGDKAKADNFQTQAGAIVYRLADPDRSLEMEQAAIEGLKQLYEAYPPPVQQAIRRDILPRLPFTLPTGWVKCPYCVRGMTSPDREEFDEQGRPTAVPKEICANCRGAGEVKDDGTTTVLNPLPTMSKAEIEAKFGVVVED